MNSYILITKAPQIINYRMLYQFIILTICSITGQASPYGAEVVLGNGSITQSGVVTTINQSSHNLSLNWKDFNIAPNETVNFIQPSASSIAVNRIYNTQGTQIFGRLNANGHVYLINPNGILFGSNAQINVGALVASTLETSDLNLNADIRFFSGVNSSSIINQGTITAANGGYVVLLGNHVSNQGTITAQLGTVVLGSGSTATLTFDGNSLIQMQIEQSILDSLSENRGLIKADGGMVIMSAGAKDILLSSVVNNTGVIEARTVENHNGTIVLLGGMNAGFVNVGGILDASAPNGGNGGTIETSASHVKIADNVIITTAAVSGNNGVWLIDPVDFTVAASGGDITGVLLGSLLDSNSITIQTIMDMNTPSTLFGTIGTNGDINVNDPVTWNANNTLTLKADRNININKSITATTGKLALEYGQAGIATSNTSDYTVNAVVNLSAGPNFSTKLGLDGITKIYTVITDLGVAGSMNSTDLQGINGALSGYYALGSNIDATGTSGWNVNTGFTPIGSPTLAFGGTLDGLGHTISSLNINSVTTYRGLFGLTSTDAMIRNIGLVNVNITGTAHVGGLIGSNFGTVSNSYVTGSVTGTSPVGGLIGSNTGPISNSYAEVNVIGTSTLGGLIGSNTGSSISNSYATGSVKGDTTVGGLLGSNTGNVVNSYASGNISSGSTIGGLMGSNTGIISNTYATGSVNGTTTVGGLMGSNTGPISNSYSTGIVSGTTTVGGLLGSNTGVISNSYWDITTSGQATSAAGVGMTTPDMKIQSNFTSWDFVTAPIWIMYDTLTYPLLYSLMTPLTVSANNANKTYDKIGYSGGNSVTYSIIPTVMPTGTLTYAGNSQGALNVGGYTITPGGLQSNQQYLVNYVDAFLNITPKALTITAAATADKVYDGGTTSTTTAGTLSGFVSGETVTAGVVGTFTDKDAASAITVNDVYTLADGTGLASNYSLADTTSIANISAKPITITATAGNKVYDATTAATASLASAGIITGDTITLGGSATFADKNVAVGKTVTVASLIKTGTDALNYTISNAIAASTANITKAPLAITGITAQNKIYDATIDATLSGTASITPLGNDDLSIGGAGAGVFDTKHVGINKPVTVSGYTLGGIDATNYTLIQPSEVRADIMAVPVAINTDMFYYGANIQQQLRVQSSRIREYSSCNETDDLYWNKSLNNTIMSSTYNIEKRGLLLHILDCDINLLTNNEIKVSNDEE